MCQWVCPLVSISPIIYKQLFCTKVFCAAFICLQFGFVIFWRKSFGAKAAHKMLVKLTPGRDGGLLCSWFRDEQYKFEAYLVVSDFVQRKVLDLNERRRTRCRHDGLVFVQPDTSGKVGEHGASFNLKLKPSVAFKQVTMFQGQAPAESSVVISAGKLVIIYQGPHSQWLYFFVSYEWTQQARVFVPSKPF